MNFVKALLYVLVFFKVNIVIHGQSVARAKETVGEFINKKIEVITKTTTNQQYEIIELKEPALSLVCDKTRGDKIKFVKDINGYLFFLSINELFAVKVNHEIGARMFFLGTLLDIAEEDPVLSVQIEEWQNHYMVVVQQSTRLKVYLIRLDEELSPEINHIHKMNFDSIADKFRIFRRGDDVLLVTYQIQEHAANKLTFYKWHNSFFMKESSDTTELPNKGDLFVYNEHPDDTLILSLGYGVGNETSHVTVFKYDQDTNRWLKMQKMHFKKDYLEPYIFNGTLHLLGCYTDTFCAMYKWKHNTHFHRQLKLSNNIFELIKSIYSRHSVIIIENFQNKLSFYSSNNITSVEPALKLTKPTEVSQYSVYKSPTNQLYFVEARLNETTMFISFREMTINENVFHKMRTTDKEIDPIECILQLKKSLKNRSRKVKTFEKSIQKLHGIKSVFDITKKNFLDTNYVRLQDSKVLTLKMPYNVSMQTKDLMQQSVSVNIHLGKLNQLLKSKSAKTDARANENDDDDVSQEGPESISVQNLIYQGKQPLFRDIMRKSQPKLSLSDQIKLRELSANKLVVQTNQINSIHLDKLLNKTKVQSVSGTKTLHSVTINELKVDGLLNNVPVAFMKLNDNSKLEQMSAIDIRANISARHLNVKVLNGFNVSSLMNELVIDGNRTSMYGDLLIKSSLNVNKLLANHIKSTPINNFMTTSTDQNIEADVSISKFHASKINANLVNNENIVENIAVLTDNNHIEVPTKFMTVNIMGNLNIQDIVDEDENASASKEFVEMIKRHVIGTQTSDLSQIYNNKVVIRGSLTIKDVSTYSPKTKIFVSNHEVPQNISESFWMKSKNQQVFVPSFKINNAQVTLSNGVVTRHLNRHPVDSFLLLNSEKPQGPIFARFENAIIEGNVVVHDRNYPSMLYRLNQLAIHRDSSSIEVSSPVEFRNQMIVKNLHTRLLNNIPISTLVHKNLQYVLFDGVKAVESVEASQVYVDKSLFIENYNNVSLEKFMSEVIRIDQPMHLENLRVENFTALNLLVNKFEGHKFSDMMKNIQHELNFGAESKKGKRSIRIHGDAEFKSNIFIDFLNGDTVQFNEFIDLLAMANQRNQEIGGRKVFTKDFTVTESIQAQSINGKSMDRLLHQSLSRGDKQTVEATRLSVNNLKVTALHANKLNSLTWNHFIDKTKLESPLALNLEIDEIEVENLYTESSTIDVRQIQELIKFPRRTNWNYVEAAKGSYINFGDETRLDHLIKYGVKKTAGTVQEVLGNVKVQNTHSFYMNNVRKDDAIVNTPLSAFNLTILDYDSVKNYSPLEVVSGSRVIPAHYRFDANNLIIEPQCYFSASYINEVNIKELNKTIHRNEDMLNSEKHFENLFVHELYIENGLLNEVDPSSIVYVSNTKQELPVLYLKSLEVGNMQVTTFNTYSFEYMLENRLRKYGAERQDVQSLITFDSIHFERDTVVTTINDVFIADAVFTSSDQLQQVTGRKIVNGRVILKGPAHIGHINSVDLVEFHKSTVSLKQDYRSDTLLQLPAIELREGMHVEQNINDRNVEELLSSDAHTPKLKDLVSLIGDVRRKIATIDSRNIAKRENRRMLYIDVDENIEFKYKPSSARNKDDAGDDAVCGRQNELEFNPQSREVTISRRSTSEMVVELKSMKVKVSPNIVCKDGSVGSKTLELRWNYNYDSENKYFRNFAFPNIITDVKFTESIDGVVHMVLVVRNETTAKSEIAFLKLNKVEHDWEQQQQTLKEFYETAKIATVEAHDGESYVVVSTFNANAESDRVVIYRLDKLSNLFVQSQQSFTGAGFDIILGINVKPKSRAMRPRTFLLFSRVNGREIKMYRMKDGSKEFTFQRMLDDFNDKIVEVLVLYINEMPYFIVSQRSGLFCMYEWRGIESWQRKYCGRFENINQMKSFEYLNRQHLFLASIAQSNVPSINALAIYRQGDFF